MALVIYNTLTRKKEPFLPLHPPQVTMYNCGPTVYNYFHIGNARNFVFVDVVRRHLERRGYRVKFVQNLTDIDDKIIQRSLKEGVPADAIAGKYTQAYFEQADKLNVRRADAHPKATEHIEPMLRLIQTLLDKRAAYVSGGDVYFRVRSFDGYGALSGNNLENLREGARVEVNTLKERQEDFDLWKAAKPGEPSWPSPWGPGRPGWHLECSAMVGALLGETIDIHSGGADLTFPHHENERAQSECATGRPLARYWLHNGFLTIRGQEGEDEKMSKSAGNDSAIQELTRRFDPMAIRAFLLSAHYRSPLAYSTQAIGESEAALARLRDGLETAEKLVAMGGGCRPAAERSETVRRLAEEIRAEFDMAMDDDFNTPRALAALFRGVNEIHEERKKAADGGHDSLDRLATLSETCRSMMDALGLAASPTAPAGGFADGLAGRLLDLLVIVRAQARQAKVFELADLIRKELESMDVLLEDHPQGTIWKRKPSDGG